MKKPNDDPTEASIKATKDWYNSLTKQQQQLVFFDTKTYAKQHEILFPQKKVEDTKVTPTSTKTTASTKTTTVNKPSTVSKVMAGTALVGDALNLFPPTSLLGYGIGLAPTTYDVVNNLKKGKYKEAGTDALGYIPALKYIKKGINLKKGLDNLNSFHKFNTGIQMINTIKDVKDAKEEFAYGGSTNRFMQPSQYYEPTKGFKLDYNQLAAGVLAREDAYDQNATQIDAMDQDYIQGITGIESDRAKEINSNISTMVNTIGDQYNGDLSKAGDAVRNAKKYIKQTTGFDSEGALINANLKAYNKDIKDIDKKKDWSLERKNQAKQDALVKHNKLTGESRTTSGDFSTYSNRGMENYFDIQALTMEAVKNITPETYQKAWGAKWTGRKDADGNYEFLQSGTQKTIKKTPQEILSLVPDVLQNNPQAMAYMKEDAYLGTVGIPQEYYDKLKLEQDLKKEKLSEVQNMGSTKDLQQLLIDEGYLAKGQDDGDQGPITDKALLAYTSTLNKTFDQEWAQNEYMNGKVAGLGNQGVKQYAQNDVINTINYTQGIAYANGIKAAKEKVLNTVNGFAESKTNKEYTYKELEEAKKAALLIYSDSKAKFETATGISYPDDQSALAAAHKLVNTSDENLLAQYGNLCPGCSVAQLKRNPAFLQQVDAANALTSSYVNNKVLARNGNKRKPTVELESTLEKDFTFLMNVEMAGAQDGSLGQPFNSKGYKKHEAEIKATMVKVAANNGTGEDFIAELMKNPVIAKDMNLDELPAEHGSGWWTGITESLTDAFLTDHRINVLTMAYDRTVGRNRKVIDTDYGSIEASVAFTPTNVNAPGELGNTRAASMKETTDNYLVSDMANNVGPIANFQMDEKGKPIAEKGRSYGAANGVGLVYIVGEDGVTRTYQSKEVVPIMKKNIEDAWVSNTNTPEAKQANNEIYFETENVSFNYKDANTFANNIDGKSKDTYPFTTKKGNYILVPVDNTASKQFYAYKVDEFGNETPALVYQDPADGTIIPIPYTDPRMVQIELGNAFIANTVNKR